MKQERIDRLLADAEALRQARDIRAYVQEVTELCAEDSGHVSPEALREWRQWALAQADRIDPVVSGAFRKSMEDPTDDLACQSTKENDRGEFVLDLGWT